MEKRHAIAVHHTATSSGAWDGPAAEANLKLDQTADYYRKAFAWQDPDKDPKTKAAFRFIHHEVDAEGDIGAANTRGCSTGIGVLNGARGGTTIPAADKSGVWSHLAAHLKDAGETAPELKMAEDGEIVKRSYPLTEIRLENRDAGLPKIIGHAAVFNSLSLPLGWGYREKVLPGAFTKTLQEADIRALFNHDANMILGRNKAGTLSLLEDDKGLAIEIDPPDTSYGRDLIVSIKRKDVDQMSFSFLPVITTWDESNPDEPVRSLVEAKLFDVAPVVFPAYPDTDVAVRSILEKKNIDFVILSRAIGKSTYGIPLSQEDIAVVRRSIEILQVIHGPAQEDHPKKPAETSFRTKLMLRELELIELS